MPLSGAKLFRRLEGPSNQALSREESDGELTCDKDVFSRIPKGVIWWIYRFSFVRGKVWRFELPDGVPRH